MGSAPGPALAGRHCEQREHGVGHVVVVERVSLPVALSDLDAPFAQVVREPRGHPEEACKNDERGFYSLRNRI